MSLMSRLASLLLVSITLGACAETIQISGSDGRSYKASLQPKIIRDILVDGLRIRQVRLKSETCSSGFQDSLEIDGNISEDSTATMQLILPKLAECRDKDGRRVVNIVYMNSNGGYLADGFKLGRLFRKHATQTRVTGGQTCSSACAIAFLGGDFRSMADTGKLIYHAPYTLGRLGISVDCRDRGQVSDLREYYIEMLDKKTGDFLLDRTMRYCSSSEGWTINSDAAELFGILR